MKRLESFRPEYGRGDHPYAQGFYAAMDSYNQSKPVADNPYTGEFETEAKIDWNEGWETYVSCCLPLDYEDIRC